MYNDISFKGARKLFFEAFVCACIDDIFETDKLRQAVRKAVIPIMSKRNYGFPFIIIVCAVAIGNVMSKLPKKRLNEHGDASFLFGKYVSCNAVSARDIIQAVIDQDGSESDNSENSIKIIGVQSLIWNLFAIDVENNISNPQIIVDRITKHVWKAYHIVAQNIINDRLMAHHSVHPMLIYKSDIKFGTELRKARNDASSFVNQRTSIYVCRLRGRQIVAWIYIVSIVILSFLCAYLNIPGRDNIYDRVKDAFDVMTILLVSVFGLVKLTSEDPNALRNIALGRKLISTLEDANKYLSGDVKSLQKLFSVQNETFGFSRNCSYMKNGNVIVMSRQPGPDANLEVGPAEVSTLKERGFFFLEGICKRPHSAKECSGLVDKGQNIASGIFQFQDQSIFDMNSMFFNVPRFNKVR